MTATTPYTKPDPKLKARRQGLMKMTGTVAKKIEGRLIAIEFMRNGLSLSKAYETVTKKKWHANVANQIFHPSEGTFLKEVEVVLEKADIDKNKVLSILWAHATFSPLDFYNDDGTFLTIEELKKLPREAQALIEEISVKSEEVPLKDEHGIAIVDEDGKPVLGMRQFVKIKFPNKQGALDAIAKIGGLIGPAVVNNNYIGNMALYMTEADQRRSKIIEGRLSDESGS